MSYGPIKPWEQDLLDRVDDLPRPQPPLPPSGLRTYGKLSVGDRVRFPGGEEREVTYFERNGWWVSVGFDGEPTVDRLAAEILPEDLPGWEG